LDSYLGIFMLRCKKISNELSLLRLAPDPLAMLRCPETA
jgi:hypothetical protein